MKNVTRLPGKLIMARIHFNFGAGQCCAVLSWARLGAGDKTTVQLSFAYHYPRLQAAGGEQEGHLREGGAVPQAGELRARRARRPLPPHPRHGQVHSTAEWAVCW